MYKRKFSSKILKQILAKKNNCYGAPLLNLSVSPDVDLKKPLTVSVVIPAYNVQSSILACLASIEQSSFNINHQNRLQVIVVNDGSTDDTWKVIKNTDFSLHLTAIRQTNHGQARALNTGISVAEGDIIISCDSDMVLGYYTIEHFVMRHQQMPNVLLAGFRSDTPKTDPRVDYNFIRQYGSHIGSFFANDERIIFPIPGWPSNMCLASDHFRGLGQGRGLWMPDNDAWLLPDLVIGALFSLSRSVYFEVGGYDERLHGWGCTDGYLAAKAIGAGQYIIPLYVASGLHISHPAHSENKQLEYTRNRKLFFKFIKTSSVDDYPNWLAHAKDRIVESFICNPTKVPSRPNIKKSIYKKVESELNEIDSLLAIGKYSQALTSIVSKTKKDNNWGLRLRLGKTLSGMNRYKEAIDILNEISVSTNFSPEATIELAIALAADSQFESAHKILNRLAQIHPQIPDLQYWYFCPAQKHIIQGRKYLNQGFHRVALRCFEAALIAEPNNRTALKFRSQCSKYKG